MKCIGFCVRAVPRVVLSCALATASICGSTPSLAATTASASGDYLYIGGSPATTIAEDNMYYFQPWVAAPAASRSQLKWSIYNKPYWATFDASTGLLYGKVYAAQEGTYRNITISATDGTVYAIMRSFSITVDAPGTPPPTNPGSTPVTISGNAPISVTVGSAYSFSPSTTDASQRTLTFSIRNKPVWASFDNTSGRLFGTPTAAAVGSYANIQISVSDGIETAVLPAFTIAVNAMATGSTTVDWTPPTENTDGTVLTDLAGYNLYYGTSESNLSGVIKLSNPGLTRYVVESLPAGTWYFAMTTLSSTGSESARTGTVSATIL